MENIRTIEYQPADNQPTDEKVAAYERQLTRVNMLLDHMDALRAMVAELEVKLDRTEKYTTRVKLNGQVNTLRFALYELKEFTYPRERAELDKLAEDAGKPFWV